MITMCFRYFAPPLAEFKYRIYLKLSIEKMKTVVNISDKCMNIFCLY